MSKTLIEVTQEIRDLLFKRQEMIEAGEEVSKEMDDALNELMQFEAKKIDRCVSFIKMAENQVTWLKAEMDHLKMQQKKYERAIESMKEIAKTVMLENGITEMTGENGHKFSIRNNQRVKVTDLSLIPENMVRQKVIIEPDKVAIKDALKKGWKIQGAELEETASVVVR